MGRFSTLQNNYFWIPYISPNWRHPTYSVKWNMKQTIVSFKNHFTIILTNPMKNITSLILIFALGTKFLQETYDLYKLKNWAAHGSPAWYYLWINQDITNANRASLKTWALSFWHFPQFFSQKSKQLCNYFRFLSFIVM